MCGATSPLFKEIDNSYDKKSLEDLYLVMKTLSTAQINSYLGLLLGMSPLIQYPLHINEMYYQGDLAKSEAGKIWDTKYANTVPVILSHLKTQFVINVGAINHIAKNVFIGRHVASITTCAYEIIDAINKEDKNALKQRICLDNATEEQASYLSGYITDSIYGLDSDIISGKVDMSNFWSSKERFDGHIETSLSRLMENNYNEVARVANMDGIRKLSREIYEDFSNCVNGNTKSFYGISRILQDATPVNYKLSYEDIGIIVRNFAPTQHLWDLK